MTKIPAALIFSGLAAFFRGRHNRLLERTRSLTPRFAEFVTRLLVLKWRAAAVADTSFCGEFASIEKLLSRIGITQGYVVDIAAGDGVTLSSTLPLFRRGWAGLAVEIDPQKFALLASIYARFDAARLARAKVTPRNVAALLKANQVPLTFDVLNLDIDSYDLAVIEAMLVAGYRPKVISMEINEKIPPPIFFTVAYDDDHVWHLDHFYGCSLTAACTVLRANAYVLESVEFNNAMFVARECAQEIEDVEEEAAYKAGYAERTDRKALFPWNTDMEMLQTMEPVDAVAAIRRKFSAYDGKFILKALVSAE